MNLFKYRRYLTIVLILPFLMSPVFAADSSLLSSPFGIESIADILFFIGDVSSWLWIILSNIAGKLMTNSFVYGEIMGFDMFLWKIWQIMRTFANYAIGFLFLYSLFKYLFSPSAKLDSPMKVIKELLLASVLVQASRFLVMVVVDFSTILFATVSSFPSQVLANNEYVQNYTLAAIKSSNVLGRPLQDSGGNSSIVKPPEAVVIYPFADESDKRQKQLQTEFIPMDKVVTSEQLLDDLLPKPDTLSGPLMYLGFNVFKTHDFLRNYHHIKDSDTLSYLTKVVISLMLDAGMIILYAFSLFILIIVLVIRLGYLWIFIALSPIILLLTITKIVDLGKLSSFLDIKKIIALIFKPVMFALWVSVMFLVVVVFQGFFSRLSNTSTLDGALYVKESTISYLQSDDGKSRSLYTSEMGIGDVVKVSIYQGTKSFKDIILSMLTLFMMWYFIKLALTSKTGISSIDKLTGNFVGLTEKFFGNMSVVPTPGGSVGLNQVWNGGSSPMLSKGIAARDDRINKRDLKGTNKLNEVFGLSQDFAGVANLQRQQFQTVVNRTNNPDEFPNLIKQYKSDNGGIKFNDIKSFIPIWIKNNKNKTGELKKYFGESFVYDKNYTRYNTFEEINQSLEALFKNKSYLNAFYTNVLGGTDTISDYNQLVNTPKGIIKK